MALATHYVYNPTGSTITVNARSVPAHTTAVLTLSDSDAAGFHVSGATLVQLAPGTATVDEIRGFQQGY